MIFNEFGGHGLASFSSFCYEVDFVNATACFCFTQVILDTDIRRRFTHMQKNNSACIVFLLLIYDAHDSTLCTTRLVRALCRSCAHRVGLLMEAVHAVQEREGVP